VLSARQQSTRIVVPDVVLGEAFTKLRYDRHVSPRRDASIALRVFRLVDEAPEVFELRFGDRQTYGDARDILAQYADQSFSYVDAVAFTILDLSLIHI